MVRPSRLSLLSIMHVTIVTCTPEPGRGVVLSFKSGLSDNSASIHQNPPKSRVMRVHVRGGVGAAGGISTRRRVSLVSEEGGELGRAREVGVEGGEWVRESVCCGRPGVAIARSGSPGVLGRGKRSTKRRRSARQRDHRCPKTGAKKDKEETAILRTLWCASARALSVRVEGLAGAEEGACYNVLFGPARQLERVASPSLAAAASRGVKFKGGRAPRPPPPLPSPALPLLLLLPPQTALLSPSGKFVPCCWLLRAAKPHTPRPPPRLPTPSLPFFCARIAALAPSRLVLFGRFCDRRDLRHVVPCRPRRRPVAARS